MPRFFVKDQQIENDKIYISGDDAHHISRSLRMAVGDSVIICDEKGMEYDCRLIAFKEDRVEAEIKSVKDSENEPLCFVTLFQALPKGDKFDTIIQKAVECGVSRIVPFESERCVVRAKTEAEGKKQTRRQRISEEAAKQCGRSVIPKVDLTVEFDEMLSLAKENEVCLFCYEGENTEPLGKLLIKIVEMHKKENKKLSVAIIVGSEGGFSTFEAQKAQNSGFYLTGLGKRILRTETASLFVLSSIACFTELM